MESLLARHQVDQSYHDSIAPEYERVVNEPRRLMNDVLFEPLLKMIPCQVSSHLDLGCGTGQMLDRIWRNFKPKRVWAVDHSSGMLAQASASLRSLGCTDAHLVKAEISSFARDCEESFAVISCVGVLHHLHKSEVAGLLAQCKTLLEPNGALLLAEPEDVPSLYSTPPVVSAWNKRSAFSTRGYSVSPTEPDEGPLEPGFVPQVLREGGFRILAQNRGIELFPRNENPSTFDRFVVRALQKIYGSKGYVVAWLATVD